METRCDTRLAAGYKSPTQIARVLTESWAMNNLFCAACPSDTLARTRANTNVCDFACPSCSERYELKSMRRWNEYRVNDSGYAAMMRAIAADAVPNLLLMHRSDDWYVERLLLIPRLFFTKSIIERREPLATTARRAGWVGCNILIGEVPPDGRITVIDDRICIPARRVRASYERISDLERIPASLRGWTLDVLRCVRRLPPRFSLEDVYGFERELSRLHPDNRHVRDKIRQQLQVLRDIGLLRFRKRGRYESAN
jgi:type II restriction enzyme